MKTILTAACLASLFLAGTVFADHPSGGGHRESRGFDSHRDSRGFDYHRTYGRSFSHGYFYEGRNHYHWTDYRWSSRYGCYTYYCPSTYCYYYWSEPSQRYYPMSYAETVTPTRSEQRLNINVNNNNNNNNTNVVRTGSSGPTGPIAVPVPTPGGPPAQ
jgi:hypothetical protein